MPNFLAVWDPSPERRARCIEAARPVLEFLPGLTTGSLEAGSLSVVWAAADHTPVDVTTGADGSGGAVVWGHGFPAGSDQPVEAKHLQLRAESYPDGEVPCFDGFHAWLSAGSGGWLEAAGDPLGVFPLYWTRCGREVLLLASSPGAFLTHPSFVPRLDPPGLAGILMTHGLARNRTAMAGVRRLAAGHRLVFTPGTGAQEVEDYAPAPRHELRDVPRQQVLSRLDAALDRATARMCSPYPEIGMFLSGGLDSRLLLGYGLRTGLLGKTVTFGEPNDQEYRVAARVARELGLNHRRIAHRDADFAEAARLEAADALLSNGFSSLHQWSIALQRPQLPPACITGLVGDAVLSMSHVAWGKEPETDGEAISLDRFVRTLNRRWGVPHDLLSKLSRSPFREVVQSTWEALPETLGARDGSAAYRIWTADLFNRQRCHVGSVAWRLSFITWPVMPVNDRQVVDMVASIPFSLIDQRFVQTQLVIREFPRLARLPLDRNRYDTAPLQPGIRDHLVQGVAWRLANTSLGRWWRLLRPERRYYHRLYDMDAPGWQAIREAAEPHRDCLSPLFHIDRLTEAYLPAPSRKIEMGNVISEGAGRKLLLGLMLLGAELPELLGA